VVTVKAYEQYAVEAGVTGSRETALKALLTHPLVPSYSVAKAMLDELLSANRAYLPQFFPHRYSVPPTVSPKARALGGES
jgi:6-phospho-beta-glucosidase